MDCSSRLLDILATDILQESKIEDEFNPGGILQRIEVLEKILSKENEVNSHSRTSALSNELDERILQLRSSAATLDTAQVLELVQRAQRSRLGKIEHEMMAKLVNKSGDKGELISKIQELEREIANLTATESTEHTQFSNRQLAVTVLTHLIGSMQASLSLDLPSEELLPPIEEVDMTIFQ